MVPCQYDEAYDFAANGLAVVRQNGKYGYVNTAGKQVIPCQYVNAYDFASNDMALVRQLIEIRDLHMIDSSGNTVKKIDMEMHISIELFDDAYLIWRGGKLGILNLDGEVILQPVCRSVRH